MNKNRKKYKKTDKAPKFIYGYSTGLAPNHPNIKKFMMKNHITKGWTI